MGMDDVFEAMCNFEKDLENFNENLKRSFIDLKNNHEAVLPLWDDTMKKDYDRKWIPLEEKIEEYLAKEGESYVEILIEKIEAIKGYLYGT